MPKRATGRYERTTTGGEEIAAVVLYALPPARTRVVVAAALAERAQAAEQALVRLELAGEMVSSVERRVAVIGRDPAPISIGRPCP